ncbi:hypothetical protein PhCBS80983_g01472 [Powellomyces hirtus]|uniref:Velvet domain-containing protein n=1 Tax=Powellomyces hirtus TaxID=109895 RepID=A0A507EA45_9FUNG|nr:hypothetical protein PhCBS80983_g01472 [Powellomyces hirtus]
MQPSPAVSTADFGSADAQPVHHQSEGTGTAQTNQLIIRQQPNRARMCGFGTKDYRPVDPAPILQLIRTEASQVVLDYKQATSLVCHASLWSADGTEERGVVLNPGSAAVARRSESLFQNESHVLSDPVPPTGYVSVLVGSLVTDFDFPAQFPDLSIRTSGQYLLKFSLYDISQDASHAMAFAISDVISVYPPKTFPGMTESSQLAKCLARQGIKLHIRSDMRRNHNLGAAGGEPPAGFSGQEAPPGEEFGGEPEVVL